MKRLWVEKFRPKDLDSVVLNDETREFFRKCLNEDVIPHLLFYGPPGSGKTTIARILVDYIIKNEDDVMILNGSDTNGVSDIRNLQGFCTTPPLASNHKIIFIDEADHLTPNACAILRGFIEQYEENVRWMFTCNYISKLTDAIISRFQSFKFEKISEDFIENYLSDILNKEEIKFDDSDLKLIIKNCYPDVRRMVNILQQNSIEGKLKNISASKIQTQERKLVGFIIEIADSIGKESEKSIINKNLSTIHKLLSSDTEPDYRSIYDELFRSSIPPWAKIKINQYANNHQSCAIPPIHFQAMILDMIAAGREYYQLFKGM